MVDNHSSCRNHFDVFSSALKLTSSQVEELEVGLNTEPGDIESRVIICSYYFSKQISSQEAREKGFEHLKWLILNHPSSPAHDGPISMLGHNEPDLYKEGKALWLEQVDKFNHDPVVLNNAAAFFAISDVALAVELLEKAREIKPQEEYLLDRLAHQYYLGLAGPLPTDDWLEKAYLVHKELVDKPKVKSAKLSRFATIAYKARHFSEAREAAHSALEISSSEAVIHEAHTVLGLLKIQDGDIKGAKKTLKSSGPWPEFDLANKLIEIGETEVVCDFLWNNLKAWKVGKVQLLYWIAMMKVGKKPELKRGILLSYRVGGYRNK